MKSYEKCKQCNNQSVKLSNNESKIGRGKVAGYKLPGYTTQIERPKFYSRHDNDCFRARAFLRSLYVKQYHIKCDHTQHPRADEQTIAL